MTMRYTKSTYTLLCFISNREGREERGRDSTADHIAYYPYKTNSEAELLILIKSNTFTTILYIESVLCS